MMLIGRRRAVHEKSQSILGRQDCHANVLLGHLRTHSVGSYIMRRRANDAGAGHTYMRPWSGAGIGSATNPYATPQVMVWTPS